MRQPQKPLAHHFPQDGVNGDFQGIALVFGQFVRLTDVIFRNVPSESTCNLTPADSSAKQQV